MKTLLFLCLTLVASGVEVSWEKRSDANRIMANGEKFNPNCYTAASRVYPLGTILILRESHNGIYCVVKVTDKPHKRFKHRLDVSPIAFQRMNGLELGICFVDVEIVR